MHGAWSGERRWEDIETHNVGISAEARRQQGTSLSSAHPAGDTEPGRRGPPAGRSGAWDTRHTLHFATRAAWGGGATSGRPCRAGWVQPGGAQGRADAWLAPFLVGWGRGSHSSSGNHMSHPGRPRQTQGHPTHTQAWPPHARAWSKASGCCSCRRGRQPERPLQHDHAGAAGVLAGREGQLEAREAALRDRLGPHRAGEAVQVCGKHRGRVCGPRLPQPGRAHTHSPTVLLGEVLGNRAKGRDGVLGTCQLRAARRPVSHGPDPHEERALCPT